jgi:hypothetical protein
MMGHGTLICGAFSLCDKQRAAPGEPVRCVDSADRAAKGREGVAPGHNSWAVCSAVRPNVLYRSSGMLLFALYLRARCSLATVLWLAHAHTWIEARMRAV